jgi:hypothetical protein
MLGLSRRGRRPRRDSRQDRRPGLHESPVVLPVGLSDADGTEALTRSPYRRFVCKPKPKVVRVGKPDSDGLTARERKLRSVI